jgi:hypothetical protein
MFDTFFPKIEAPDVARNLSKQGAMGILVLAGMYLLGALIALFANKSPVNLSGIDAQQAQDQVIGAVFVLPVLLFFAYRVSTGKGLYVAGLTLAWFLAEIAMKIAGGSANFGWMIFYVSVAAGMVNGIRGCWWLRKLSNSANLVSES